MVLVEPGRNAQGKLDHRHFTRDTKAPYDEQIVVGLDHELFKNFKVSLNYMYKVKKNILDDALYDLETGQTWYNPTTTR